jgi:Coenzyme PQQ synthesis protein D (PqqD)
MESTARPEPHVQAVVDEEGAVLLDLKRGRYFAMNGVAAEIWNGLQAGRTAAEIEAELLRSHAGADPATVRADVDTFVARLAGEGLVHG